MKSRAVQIILTVSILLAGYVGYLAWRASRDRVTLHVRNLPLTKVIEKIRWQTWETFALHKDVKGEITLDVDDLPLEDVLEIIGQQIQSRWTKVYPIYLKKEALKSLDQALRGEIEFAQSKFTNWQSRPFGMRGGGGPGGPGGFGDAVLNQNKLVSLQIADKDIRITSQALSRFSQAQVLPENGISARINLELSQEEFDDAVDKVADQAKRSWTKLYAFLPARGMGGGPGGFAGFGPPGEGDRRGRRDPSEMPTEGRERNRERAEQMLEMLPPEERQLAESRRQEMQAMQSLPPEQRQQVIAERMNNPEMQQRMEQRSAAGIKNSTPEQRRERYVRMSEMRKARAAGQGQPGQNRSR